MLESRPILLVDDDTVDAMAVRRALRELQVDNELRHVLNGEEALAYLRREGNETPCLILLDLNMPRMNGLEFLEALRADEALNEIPVVVVTTSPDRQDVARSAELGAASYILKCADYAEFRESMKAVQVYVTSAGLREGLEPAIP